MEFVKIGIIVNTFGIRGELKVNALTDFIEERFKPETQLYIHYQNEYIPFIVKSYRVHKGFVLVLFKDHENINLVEKYKNCELYISKDDIAMLNDGNFYFFQLTGCDVYSGSQFIGKVSSVEKGFQSILRIDHNGKEILIPYVDAFIKDVNIADKKIEVKIIEGML